MFPMFAVTTRFLRPERGVKLTIEKSDGREQFCIVSAHVTRVPTMQCAQWVES